MAHFIHVEGDQYLGLAAVVYAVPSPSGHHVTLILSSAERITVSTDQLAHTLTAQDVAERLTRRHAPNPETQQRIQRIVAEVDALRGQRDDVPMQAS